MFSRIIVLVIVIVLAVTLGSWVRSVIDVVPEGIVNDELVGRLGTIAVLVSVVCFLLAVVRITDYLPGIRLGSAKKALLQESEAVDGPELHQSLREFLFNKNLQKAAKNGNTEVVSYLLERIYETELVFAWTLAVKGCHSECMEAIRRAYQERGFEEIVDLHIDGSKTAGHIIAMVLATSKNSRQIGKGLAALNSLVAWGADLRTIHDETGTSPFDYLPEELRLMIENHEAFVTETTPEGPEQTKPEDEAETSQSEESGTHQS